MIEAFSSAPRRPPAAGVAREPDKESFEVATDRARGIVTVAGDLDLAHCQDLRLAILAVEETRPPVLVVDLREVVHIDSTGLRVILDASTRAEPRGAGWSSWWSPAARWARCSSSRWSRIASRSSGTWQRPRGDRGALGDRREAAGGLGAARVARSSWTRSSPARRWGSGSSIPRCASCASTRSSPTSAAARATTWWESGPRRPCRRRGRRRSPGPSGACSRPASPWTTWRSPRRRRPIPGRDHTWLASWYPVRHEGEIVAVGVFVTDISDRVRAERGLQLLFDVGEALDATLGVEERLARLAALVVPTLGDFCTIEMLEPSGEARVVAGDAIPAGGGTPTRIASSPCRSAPAAATSGR